MEIDQPLLAAIGLALVALTIVDLVWTTIAVSARRGPVSDLVASTVARLGLVGRPTHRRRAILGAVTAAAVPLAWLLLLWLGFALMFLSDDDAVVVAASQAPTSALGRVAYAAGGLAGAGAGLTAGTTTWQLVNNVAALTGLALVTLALSYVLQVVSAVVSERSAMSEIAALRAPGDTAVAGSPDLPILLLQVIEGISTAAQRHDAFPILQYFHAPTSSTAPPVNLARLADLLDELERTEPDRHATTIRAGRAAIDDFLQTLRLGTAPDATRTDRLDAYLDMEGWSWDDVRSSRGDAS